MSNQAGQECPRHSTTSTSASRRVSIRRLKERRVAAAAITALSAQNQVLRQKNVVMRKELRDAKEHATGLTLDKEELEEDVENLRQQLKSAKEDNYESQYQVSTARIYSRQEQSLLVKTQQKLEIAREEAARRTLPTCDICLLPYGENKERTPRVLPCGHTICLDCCQKCLKGGRRYVECPFDRTPTEICAHGVTCIPKNFVLMRMLP